MTSNIQNQTGKDVRNPSVNDRKGLQADEAMRKDAKTSGYADKSKDSDALRDKDRKGTDTNRH